MRAPKVDSIIPQLDAQDKLNRAFSLAKDSIINQIVERLEEALPESLSLVHKELFCYAASKWFEQDMLIWGCSVANFVHKISYEQMKKRQEKVLKRLWKQRQLEVAKEELEVII